MRNRTYYLCRVIVAVILLVVLLYHSAGLMWLLEEALTASPQRQASGIIFLAVTALLGRIIFLAVTALLGRIIWSAGGAPTASLVPMGIARLTRLGAATMSDLERWAEIHKDEGESIKDAARRLEPLWDQRDLDEDISITQRRRHEAAHAVITHALGGTVMSADIHQKGNVGGSVEFFPPIPSAGPAHTMWVRLQIAVAGAVQDTIDGVLSTGSSTDIDKAQRQATMLTAASWTPDSYTGSLTPGDLIAYAIETDKKLLTRRQDAIAAIETALTDKDKLTGVEVHRILNNLNTPAPEVAAEVTGVE